MTATMHPAAPGPGGVREAAVAGAFYPGQPDELILMIDSDLEMAGASVDRAGVLEPWADADRERARREDAATGASSPGGGAPPAPGCPKAIIVPHAGYQYSGPIAAIAYARLLPWRGTITRVVLLGPAHRVRVPSMAVSSADEWDTPLGRIPVDVATRDRLLTLPSVVVDDRAHGPEHSLEVELPFLQRVLGPDFMLVPVVVGHAEAADVADLLDVVWGGDETLIVISSDLSHYHDYATARLRDERTADNIVAGRADEIGPYDACGAYPVKGMLEAAVRHDLDVELLDLRNSGDTAGAPDRVVGYGAFALTARPPDASTGPEAVPDATDLDTFTPEEQQAVLAVAVEAIRARLEHRSPAEPTGGLGERLDRNAATFVTLRDGDRLLGCIGSLDARRPLRDDVADNALGAAFRDPRMPALTPDEFARMRVHVSVLTEPERLPVGSVDEVRDAIVPGVDGVLVEAGRNRGTFLPSVWEQVPDPDDFLTHLWRKAGLRPGAWPADIEVSRYRTVEFGDDGPRPAIRADGG